MHKSLAELVVLARSASGGDRIQYRDQIARHSVAAIDAVSPWLADPVLCRFALRVIWRVGDLGDRDAAVLVLRDALDDPTVAADRDDLAFHLERLGYRIQQPPSSPRGPAPIPAGAGLGWPGFQPVEFETTDGTHWRGKSEKDSLIPHLVRPLREIDPRFDSWPIYHSPEVHIAVRDRYIQAEDLAQGFRAAKLVVYAHGAPPGDDGGQPHVAVGLYIEKGDGQGKAGLVDGRWDWPSFMRCLDDERFRGRLERAMATHGLVAGDYVGGNRFVPEGANVGFRAELHGSDLVIRSGESEEQGWDALNGHLRALPADKWHDLHIWRSWPAEEAIEAGVSFARNALVPVLSDLARLYLSIIDPSRLEQR